MGQFKAHESLKMINGVPAPPEASLFDLITQISLEKAIEIYETPKVLGNEPVLGNDPTETELTAFNNWVLASRYQNKTYRLADRIIENDVETFRRLLKVVVTQFSVNYSYNAFIDKTQNTWENRITETMTRAIEILSKVKKEEKDAYDAA